MASLMENLIEVLEKEADSYEELLTLSKNKTPIIVSGDLDKLQKIMDDEQTLVDGILNLDKKRTDVTKDIANVMNKDVTTLKLADIAGMLDNRPEEQKALAAAHDRLKGTVMTLKTVNEQNGELLKNAQEMVEFELNLIQAAKMAPETANYNKGAYNAGNYMGSNKGFDAKQ